MQNESIAIKLKKLRELHQLTIRETAKKIGVPESTYREWEYGRSIRGEPYLKIAKAFNISLDELLGSPKSSQEAFDKELDKIVDEMSKLKQKIINLKNKKFV